MLFLTACFPKNFAADERNIMQEYSECLEVTHSHPNFTLGNQFKGIMKKNADAGNTDSRRNPHRRGSSSKNAEIENYLSTHYEFRYNTVLGRTEYRSRNSGIFTKVGRYEINTLRRELDCDESIATSAENLYSIIESSFSPRINPVQEYLKKERRIDLEKATPFLKCISYEVRGRRYEAIGFANSSGGYELRDDKTFKGTIAPKDITPIFEDKAQPVCLFEGFMDFLSFLSMKGEVTNQCLVMNSVSNVARSIHYLNKRNITSVRAFLDNDDAGRKAVQEFVNTGFKVEDMAVYYRDFKDLNEFHVSRVREQQKKLEKTPNTSNKRKQVKLKIR